MFCKYCGRQIQDGEICICRQNGTAAGDKQKSAQQTDGQRREFQRMKAESPKEKDSKKQAAASKQKENKVSGQKIQPEKQKQRQQQELKKAKEKKASKPVKGPVTPEKKQPGQEAGGGKGLIAVSYVCLVLTLLSFILLRTVFQDFFLESSLLEGFYPYLIYVVPAVFGAVSFLTAIFSLQDRGIRTLSIAGILISVIFLAGIFGSMVIFPYEPESYIADEDEEDEEDEEKEDDKEDGSDEEDKEDTEKEDEEESANALTDIKEEYKAGKLDYIEAKAALDELDEEELEEADQEDILAFQTELEDDLKKQMEDLAAESKHSEIMETLSDMNEASDGKDSLITELMEKYEAEYILYLDTESKRLVSEGKKEEAVKLLEEGQDLVTDKNAVSDLLLDAQNAVGADEYIIPDSNSRYLTEDDINGLTIQQINYAKNEIYARHGRKFQSNELQTYFNSKSWYQGTIEASAFKESVLNSYEKKNAEMLSKKEFSMESGGYKLDAN